MNTMTREEILTMEPGRELDALIEQHVFGKRVEWIQDEVTDPYPIVPAEYGYIVENYSSDISAAWEVVKHLREEHDLRLHLELQNHSGCYIWLENDLGGNVTGCYEFESEIEGICKIALLAILPGEE